MNLRQLQLFIKVAETKSMSETARQMYMTQPAVSQTISELEGDLLVKLFERMNKKLILTDSGEVLYTYSIKILQLVDEAKHAINEFANMERGKLRLGSSTTIGIYLLPKIISEFKAKNKNIDTLFTIDNASVIEKMILEHQIDIGLVEGLVHSGDIEVEQLLDDELYLLCSNQHRWAKSGKRIVNPQELLQEILIFREQGSGTREIVEKALQEYEVPYRISHVLNNTEAIKRAVEADIGVAFISKLAVREEIEAGKLVKINLENIQINRSLDVIYHKDKYRSALFTAFLQHLDDYREVRIHPHLLKF